MKKTAEISNQNLVRNSDAYISSGGKINPDSEFFGLLTLESERKNLIELLNFRFVFQCLDATL